VRATQHNSEFTVPTLSEVSAVPHLWWLYDLLLTDLVTVKTAPNLNTRLTKTNTNVVNTNRMMEIVLKTDTIIIVNRYIFVKDNLLNIIC